MNVLYIITGCFILFDLLTGVIGAIKNQQFQSVKMRDGLWHKIGSILAIVLGVGIDYSQQFIDLGFQVGIAKYICVYIIIMEVASIIENIGTINPDLINEKLRAFFTTIKDKE